MMRGMEGKRGVRPAAMRTGHLRECGWVLMQQEYVTSLFVTFASFLFTYVHVFFPSFV